MRSSYANETRESSSGVYAAVEMYALASLFPLNRTGVRPSTLQQQTLFPELAGPEKARLAPPFVRALSRFHSTRLDYLGYLPVVHRVKKPTAFGY